ncbi:unnamed protein product [Closterium sp. Naga37s-1]|nr:unnamed protein product [Closterium sp. Naga37s-1]
MVLSPTSSHASSPTSPTSPTSTPASYLTSFPTSSPTSAAHLLPDHTRVILRTAHSHSARPSSKSRQSAMAKGYVASAKAWLAAQVNDEERLAANLRLLKAVAAVGGAIFLMRNFGDAMAI